MGFIHTHGQSEKGGKVYMQGRGYYDRPWNLAEREESEDMGWDRGQWNMFYSVGDKS